MIIIRGVEHVNIGTEEAPFYIEKSTEELKKRLTKKYRLKNIDLKIANRSNG